MDWFPIPQQNQPTLSRPSNCSRTSSSGNIYSLLAIFISILWWGGTEWVYIKLNISVLTCHRSWGLHQEVDARSSSPVTKHCHRLRVPSEMCNILLNPLECSNLIHQTVIRHLWMLMRSSVGVEEAEHAQPVIDGDHHNIAIRRQHATIEQVTRAPAVRLSVNKQHHWQQWLLLRRRGILCWAARNIDVEVETVFRLLVQSNLHLLQILQSSSWHGVESLGNVACLRKLLWTHGAVACGWEDSRPVSGWSGGSKPENMQFLINLQF